MAMDKGYNYPAGEIRSFYTVKDIMRIFCCGRDKAYELVRSRGFPRMTIGRKILIAPDALQKWIAQNQNSRVHL